MSLLPQYQPVSQSEAWREPTDDSWQKPPASDIDHSVASEYPPRPEGGAPVTYIFVPRYPVTGKQKSVMGVMGRDKEQTIAMVQRAFPALDEYPAARIEFLTPADESARANLEEGWSEILEEAWPMFWRNPPSRLKVQVADAPGDKARRHRHHIMQAARVLGFTFLGVASFFGFGLTMAIISDN